MEKSVYKNAVKIKFEQMQQALYESPEMKAFEAFCAEYPELTKEVLKPIVSEQYTDCVKEFGINDDRPEWMKTNQTGFLTVIEVQMTFIKEAVKGLAKLHDFYDSDVLMVYIDGFFSELGKQNISQYKNLQVIDRPTGMPVRRKCTRQDLIDEIESTRKWLIEQEQNLNDFTD
jgi:hypothetical protein